MGKSKRRPSRLIENLQFGVVIRTTLRKETFFSFGIVFEVVELSPCIDRKAHVHMFCKPSSSRKLQYRVSTTCQRLPLLIYFLQVGH